MQTTPGLEPEGTKNGLVLLKSHLCAGSASATITARFFDGGSDMPDAEQTLLF